MITPPVLLATAVGVVLGALVALAVSAARERARQALEKQGAQGEASRILQRASEAAEHIKKAGQLAGREEGFRLREAWEKDESRRRDDLERRPAHLARVYPPLYGGAEDDEEVLAQEETLAGKQVGQPSC